MTEPVTTISVRHNIEVAHRLFLTPGRCENIHGHSMWVTLSITGLMNEAGMLAGIDFGPLKKEFRGFLDTNYDHRLLLNQADPWAQPVSTEDDHIGGNGDVRTLPGLKTTPGDPTTENIARWVGEWGMYDMFSRQWGYSVTMLKVEVQETHVNFASWEWEAS